MGSKVERYKTLWYRSIVGCFWSILELSGNPCECYFIQERSKDVSFVPLWHVIRTVTVKFYLEQLMLLSVYETSMVNDWKQWSLKPQLRYVSSWKVHRNHPCRDILKFQINFTVFLNMLADKLHGTDPEDVILNAFKLLDPEGTGLIPKVK